MIHRRSWGRFGTCRAQRQYCGSSIRDGSLAGSRRQPMRVRFRGFVAGRRPALRALLLVWLALSGGAGLADEQELVQRRRAQEQTQRLAADLVSRVLDIQLQQLQENKLEALPLYDEIGRLRQNVDRLVAGEMQQVVRLLQESAEAGEATRAARILEARRLARQIVVELLAERQKVRRRLQVSRTGALARQLVELQAGILATTETLPSIPIARRDAEAVETLQDQRDALVLYGQLVAALEDTSGWGGQLAADAAAALATLEQTGVAGHLESAAAQLGRAQFRAAAASQRAALEGLRALLRQLEASQGLADSIRENAVELLRRLIEDQTRLQQATQQANLEQIANRDQLAGRQHAIEEGLASLATTLPPAPALAALVARARQASRDAELELFQARRAAAVEQQDRVLAALHRLQEQLELAQADESQAKDRLAAELESLQQLDQALGDLMQVQAEASQLARQDPGRAADKQQQVAVALADAQQLHDIPPAIQASLEETQQSASSALKALQDTASQAAVRQAATAQAEQSLQNLAAEVRATLDEINALPADAAGQQTADQLAEEASAGSRSNAAEGGSQDKPQPGETPSRQGAGQTALSQPTDSRAGNSAADASLRGRSIESQPWFSKLPPEVQQAIRASTRSRPPRGYEQRLERYFESID